MDSLEFCNGNPGSVRFGNFINYYKFHPPQTRVNILPKDIWNGNETFVGLDIGCNAGDLTYALYDFVTTNVTKNCHILAIDIDPTLIQRAVENNTNVNVTFCCLDFTKEEEREKLFNTYLLKFGVNKFSATFCFSVTMWIHLNHGDDGLNKFLKKVCSVSNLAIIEPQPWKCYKTAVKRLKLSKETFNEFNNLKIRNNVESEIENMLLSFDGTKKIKETERTSWGRKILFFKINK